MRTGSGKNPALFFCLSHFCQVTILRGTDMIQLFNDDCLEILPRLSDESVELILVDLPYAVTDCEWDVIIPFEFMWKELNRIAKPKTPMVFTATQPFTSMLLMSNKKQFKHEWIWEKSQGTNPMASNYAPMKCHESVLVFGNGSINYFPQMEKGKPYGGFSGDKGIGEVYGKNLKSTHRDNPTGERFPRSVQYFKSEKGFHPTQKPVELMEYLVNTYCSENGTVLDFTMGSGTTGVAAVNCGRNFIGVERDDEYFKICQERIGNAEKIMKKKENGVKRFFK